MPKTQKDKHPVLLRRNALARCKSSTRVGTTDIHQMTTHRWQVMSACDVLNNFKPVATFATAQEAFSFIDLHGDADSHVIDTCDRTSVDQSKE